MLNRMGLVILAGKGLLGTRTGRALAERLGRSIARTALARLRTAAAGTDDLPASGRRSGQNGRMDGRHGGHGRGRQDGLLDAVLDALPQRERGRSRPGTRRAKAI